VKKITDYSTKELIATLWAKFINLFRKTR